ncbi:dihydroflavonol reductase [Medicago truncatula]|uniref:Dihydroflavonol reductase n=1 Tax=Medicago truncatula TaxID=3880 RepID=A0A072TGL0_MEDTR|nr:dihydroflavonol reductase [Medicago truncatula]
MEHKVCVTGASGFLASWLMKRLLLSGYHVIGTIRHLGKKHKVEHLWKLEGPTERLELVQADLMEQNSFDKAIMGCKAVFHIASPVPNHISNGPKAEILEPAVQGTLNVLRSCRKNPALVRVVLAASSSAVRKFQWHGRMGYVHMDDVALSHILLYENKASHGRYLCSSAIMDNDDLVAMLANRYPGFPFPKGRVSLRFTVVHTSALLKL